MKKVVSYLFFLLLLVACSNKNANEEYSIGDTIESDSFKTKINYAVFSEGYIDNNVLLDNFLMPNTNSKCEEGKTYFLYEVEVEYIGNDVFDQYINKSAILYYGDYEFDSKCAYFYENNKWYLVDGVEGSNEKTLRFYGTNNSPIKIRGLFEVPKEVEYSEKGIQLELKYFAPNCKIVVRNENY